jgi:hypothetical protein
MPPLNKWTNNSNNINAVDMTILDEVTASPEKSIAREAAITTLLVSARGVAVIQYCAQNLHIAPVFRPRCSGCLAARPTRSCESRRCLMGMGRCKL